ncbi:helix-turn-helix domain-containing protein [Micromonospora zamorensis]|uniref:helix-turn-helix domain-containing protein n=1 Tax=Micromonospora zamorensis TaxID=709883 RepID=UPI003D8BC126
MPHAEPTPPDLQAAFGLAVRRARTGRGLSQEQLAAGSGLDRTYVSGLERGRRNPTLITQHRLAAALGMKVAELVSIAEEMQ